MDWNKTKNILIFTLLLMNFFLIYTIYFKDAPPAGGYDHEAVTALLEERNIDIKALAIKHYETLPKFELTKEKLSLTTVTALTGAGYDLSEKGDLLILTKALEAGTEEGFESLHQELREILGIEEGQWRVIYDREDEFFRKILYNQCEKGFCFDDGFLKIEALEGETLRASFQPLVIQEQGGIYEENIYPYEKAVLNLIEALGESEELSVMLDFQMVYRVEDQENLKTDSISSSYPTPYWRGVTAAGEKIFIDGLR